MRRRRNWVAPSAYLRVRDLVVVESGGLVMLLMCARRVAGCDTR
jgi:hypothetical protein